MLKSIKIENFRGFKSFELQQIGRINLLVGENNSGKTSILEAIQLLCSRTNLEPLGEIMINRGEYFWSDDPREERELDICHLFYDHQFDIDSQFSISGINDNLKEEFSVSIGSIKLHIDADLEELEELDEEKKRELIEELSSNFKSLNFRVVWKREDEAKEIVNTALSDNNCLSLRFIKRSSRDKKNQVSRTVFVNSSSLNTTNMKELFEEVVLTPEEELATEALRIIDPKIERIAPANVQKATQMSRLRSAADSHTGFFVRLSDKKQRVPIGSMGDGVWRILGLALAIVSAKDGYLFVDEIDTGLHFTTMLGMWKMIWDTAKRLNVQVFATTHNNDCWKSLADIAEQEDVTDDGIRIHRIERGKEKSIVFNEAQIVIAAQRELEIR
ncbi:MULTISPECIES: ATP/GTP-binding protein [unclassified Dolichospermum]|uniref:AAA family ATPase n=1 Tax=unclassified Dolichospermum TaxID=2622029 RepID=UPI0014481EAC|nr:MULTISPECIES: AAA family ATPase [unclassified Dolichospermum]MTJ15612.1 AAA family ATPase [Dolichospermum sp. UHCC 0299]MTJ41135.1 AAA family ATPase [Dolichospermum sp. UHCC 0406]